MAKIQINNPRQIINGGAKKYYFKVKGLGGPKGDKGDKGDTGSRGPQGEPGNAATVYVGSTTTLEVGQDATVENVGTQYNAVLNFGIPKGPRGPQGIQGERGRPGQTGQTGPRGPQGERGTNATVYVGTTTTTNPGTQARVYNSGTESNAVLNFEIPRGDVGPSVPLAQETGYSTTKAMSQNATTEALNGKQNTLTAGSNIQISGSTISATDTKYSAGNGITLTGTQFSANTSVLATKNDLGSYYTKTQIDSQMAAKQDDLVAGSNIQIAPDGKTISATDTTYTAGTGLTLTGTEFSADTTVLATQAGLTTALAPKLETEVVAELPSTGTEGKLYLTPKAHTTQAATGNPITATVAEEAGAIESFQLDGDTYQQSYTGQNLYNVAQVSSGTYVTKDNDGWITITRDNTSGDTTVYTNVWTSNLALETSTQYKIFIEVKAVSGTGSLFVTSTNSTQGQFNSWQEKNLANMVAGQTYTVAPTTKSSFSGISQGLRTVFQLTAGQGGSVTFRLSVCASSTPTETFSYEPYTGGQPSPSPDYPQPVQTVTGEQTVEIIGKNLFDGITTEQLILSDGTISSNDNWNLGGYIKVSPNTTYIVSFKLGSGGSHSILVPQFDGDKGFLARWGSQTTAPYTFTTGSTTEYIRLNYNNTNNDTDFQVELGSTASPYTPYSKQTLPISLGSIELCKLGTYQDYIYKSGNDWKVHKECDSGTSDIHINGIDINSSGTSTASRVGSFCSLRADNPSIDYDNTLGRAIASENIGIYKLDASVIGNAAAESMQDGTFCQRQGTNDRVYFKNSAYAGKTGEEIRAIIAAQLGGTNYWYPLATPTDTTITDQNLIAQLEAIRTASLQNGANTITNTATGTNLAGDMEIGYYGFNPTNRYDKFIWLDLNNNYEQIGS